MMRRQTMGNTQLILGHWLSLKIMQDMRETGYLIKISVRVREDKFGRMGQCMRDGGWIIRLMAKVGLFMLTEMFTMDNGLTIKLMDLVFTAIWMVPNMRDTGKKINSTVKD